ncbi:MAG: hypothetical protein ABIS17_07485, partial [Casimicrobiaceae bacterium]
RVGEFTAVSAMPLYRTERSLHPVAIPGDDDMRMPRVVSRNEGPLDPVAILADEDVRIAYVKSRIERRLDLVAMAAASLPIGTLDGTLEPHA